LCIAKRNVPYVSRTAGKLAIQLLLTDSEPGNASEKQDGNHPKGKAGLPAFFIINNY